MSFLFRWQTAPLAQATEMKQAFPVKREDALTGFLILASFTLVAAILYFAKVVFIPLALATLLTFLLAPVVIRLQRWKLPKSIAIVTTVALAFSVIGVLAAIVTQQVVNLAAELPNYEATLHDKIQQLKTTERPGAFSRAGQLIKRLGRDLERTETETEELEDGLAAEPEPVKVQIKPAKPTTVEWARRLAGPFLGVLAMGGIVLLLVVLMLFQREDLRDRFIKLVSGGYLNTATEAVDDAARRISRYLIMQLVVNATYGVPIGIGLYFIGVPNALLWGLLATLLRFIPFLGPWLAAACPVVLAMVVDPGWTKLLLTAGLFLAMEVVSNNVVEPWLYGHSTGISIVALVAAAIFWTWLWGPVGLFLSTPLTVCLVVMGNYVPGLKFLSVLLGSEPALEPPARLYQRMLSMNTEEMLSLAEDYLKAHELVDFYDRVMIPALNAAEEDRHNGSLAEVRQQFIRESSRELIEELGAQTDAGNQWIDGEPARVFCVPAKDEADELAALMLVQVLRHEGVPAEIVSATILPTECVDRARREKVEAVCVSAVPPAALPAARQWCRKVKDHCGGVKTILCIWSPQAQVPELTRRLGPVAPHAVVTTLREAVQQLSGGNRSVAGQTPASPVSGEAIHAKAPRV